MKSRGEGAGSIAAMRETVRRAEACVGTAATSLAPETAEALLLAPAGERSRELARVLTREEQEAVLVVMLALARCPSIFMLENEVRFLDLLVTGAMQRDGAGP